MRISMVSEHASPLAVLGGVDVAVAGERGLGVHPVKPAARGFLEDEPHGGLAVSASVGTMTGWILVGWRCAGTCARARTACSTAARCARISWSLASRPWLRRRRAVTPRNVQDIAPVPLFVRLPGQERGRVSRVERRADRSALLIAESRVAPRAAASGRIDEADYGGLLLEHGQGPAPAGQLAGDREPEAAALELATPVQTPEGLEDGGELRRVERVRTGRGR